MTPLLGRHAEQRLRRRTGWPRKAARRAAASLAEEGRRLSRTPRGEEWSYRGLIWVIKGGRVVTVFPPNHPEVGRGLG